MNAVNQEACFWAGSIQAPGNLTHANLSNQDEELHFICLGGQTAIVSREGTGREYLPTPGLKKIGSLASELCTAVVVTLRSVVPCLSTLLLRAIVVGCVVTKMSGTLY